MTTVDDTLSDDEYDEFGLLHENAEEIGLELDRRPIVGRAAVDLHDGGRLSYIRWGDAPPEIVLLHGGGQNAHTWDTVLLKLGRPAIAFDLPGHGRSSRREDRNYGPWNNASAVAEALDRLLTAPVVLVVMSLVASFTCGVTSTMTTLRKCSGCVAANRIALTPPNDMPTRRCR